MMKTITKRAVLGAALIIAAVFEAALLGSCGKANAAAGASAGTPAAEAPVEETPVFAVNTTPAVQGQIRDYLALTGDIVAGSSVDAYSDVAGKITRLYVSVGSRVSKGAPLAEVDPSRPGMNYVAGVASAPIAGTIVSLPAQVGMTISQAVPIARIAGGNALEIRLYVAERFISKMTTRLPCEILLDAYPGEIFRGSVTEVSPVVDPASRTMEVRVNVDNPGSRLKAGMFAKVQVITERKNNIVKIPSTALIQRFGETYVFTAEPDPANPGVTVARKKIITPGILVDGVLEVQTGLKADEEVVVRGQSLLEDGSRIKVVDRVPPLSAT
ncbi:MAG: efflux RND transporter periplasmic adaptor subunit [Treponema sp.]|jgi:multidrug efflux pump subunit AcrA (membrane-fusion protein)|nr:efflux RND transporter periplasmic adaptor subunit [Treponema sp.]